jgi:hypothetical protein
MALSRTIVGVGVGVGHAADGISGCRGEHLGHRDLRA